MSDIESRRFTAVLNTMEDRIDPDRIERTRIANAKYLIENELVLLRDILSNVMNDIRRQLVPGQGGHRQRRSRESLAAHQGSPPAAVH